MGPRPSGGSGMLGTALPLPKDQFTQTTVQDSFQKCSCLHCRCRARTGDSQHPRGLRCCLALGPAAALAAPSTCTLLPLPLAFLGTCSLLPRRLRLLLLLRRCRSEARRWRWPCGCSTIGSTAGGLAGCRTGGPPLLALLGSCLHPIESINIQKCWCWPASKESAYMAHARPRAGLHKKL